LRSLTHHRNHAKLGKSFVDWFFLLILDIGNTAIEEIPLGARILDGLMQAVSVKAAGFAIIPLATLAPAVKVLFVMMMYIGVCVSLLCFSTKMCTLFFFT
jgi:Trk-type K+ transport system membrane component